MTRVLFSAFSNITWDKTNPQAFDPFYEGFIQELSNYENDVLVIRANNIISMFDSSLDSKNTHYFKNIAKQFNPEIIITPNHAIPRCILEVTECPIVVIGADSTTYYSDKEYIRNEKTFPILHPETYFYDNRIIDIYEVQQFLPPIQTSGKKIKFLQKLQYKIWQHLDNKLRKKGIIQ